MRTMNRFMITAAALLLSASVQAQANPELGDVGASADASASTDTGAQAQWSAPAAPAGESDDTDDSAGIPGDSDHASVIGALGVGFFGVMNVPVMNCTDGPGCTAPASDSTPAPSIGARYWLDEAMAIEAALGLSITSGSFETTGGMGGAVPIAIEPSTLAFVLHGGVPLVLAHSGHFAFEAVPYLNVGLASGSLEPPAGPATSVSGFLLELGGRVGAEIHFGFIDIPQLALMGSVGLSLRFESRGAEQDGSPTKVEQSNFALSTGVGNDPWDIFTSSITAIYYFGT